MVHMSVSILGAGRVGQSLARLLSSKGYRIDHLVCRNMAHAQAAQRFVAAGRASTTTLDVLDSDLLFITTPDDQIEVVCRDLAASGALTPQHILVHCSGALGIESLQAAIDGGARGLGVHPLQTVASPQSGVALLPGSYFGIEAEPGDVAIANQLVQDLGGIPLDVSRGKKALYHAGAVFASNYIVVLLDIACNLLADAGVERDAAVQALAKLAAGAVQNVGAVGVPQALTGPIERSDTATISRHLSAIAADPQLVGIYVKLGEYAARMATLKHPEDHAQLEEIQSLLLAAVPKKG